MSVTNQPDKAPIERQRVTIGDCVECRFVTDTAGTPRTRALAASLRRAVTDSGAGVRQLAKELGIAHSTLSQWINGRRVPRVEDVAALLTRLDVTGADRERILELAHNASDTNWLTAGVPGISQQLAGVMECERTASNFVDWSPDLVPGLLQTGDYARTILAGLAPRTDVETRVTLRVGRRDVLTRAEEPLRFTALIGETAISHCIGSPAVRAHQLRHLLKTAELDNVTIRVVPLSNDWHPGRMGPFSLYDFPRAPSIVHLEHHRSGVFLYDEDDVAEYKAAAGVLCERAMSPEDTAEFIAKHID